MSTTPITDAGRALLDAGLGQRGAVVLPPVCPRHGTPWRAHVLCATEAVLAEVSEERERQFKRYGTNDALLDGTGPRVQWASPNSEVEAQLLEKRLRHAYERHEERHGAPTWRHVLLEEVAEAFQEDDLTRLREELVQVAAVAVSWVESLDAREA